MPSARFRELEIAALPYVIVYLVASNDHALLFLQTGSDQTKLARDFFGIAYAESIRYHVEHPVFELHNEETLDEASRTSLAAQHRRFAMKPFLRCGVGESLASALVDELVLK